MTTSTPDSPLDEAASDLPWKMIDEFRVGEIFIRLVTRPSQEEHPDFEYILANTAAGLDSPEAFRVGNYRHFSNALWLVDEMSFLSMSASMSEERAFNREFVRRGAVSIDQEPPPWTDLPELYPEADTPKSPEQPVPDEPGPFCQDFVYAGLYGRVTGKDRLDPDSFRVSLATNQCDLGTYRELPIRSHADAYMALWAAGVIIDMACEMSSRTAFGYRELAHSKVTLLTPHEQDK